VTRACDGHRGHGETGCGWRGDAGTCPACGGATAEVVTPEPRRPVAGWGYSKRDDLWRLRAGSNEAMVYRRSSDGRWAYAFNGRPGDAPTIEAAQLAAEDALVAVLAESAGSLGYRLVKS
jgi:hypothetical protein